VIAVYVAASLAAGFALGRVRPHHIVDWAEDWTAPGWKHWRFWPAAPVAIACLAAVWIVHPRRTLANVRSWRAGERLHPTPEYQPEWVDRRTGDAP
jgi:hypothetical protein